MAPAVTSPCSRPQSLSPHRSLHPYSGTFPAVVSLPIGQLFGRTECGLIYHGLSRPWLVLEHKRLSE